MIDHLKPGRYINKEWNSVHKDWDSAALKVVLSFPDIYEIGMSHLGLKILYGLLNREKDVLCERVFAPWLDKEKSLRNKKEKLTSLESKRVLKEFDIIGFSLQYEMNYPDALNILELGCVPIFSKDRGEDDPIVIAGGPCSFNPEPMSDFIDLFVIGESEEVILDVVRIVKNKTSRSKTLEELGKLDGVYVPALSGDKTIKRLTVKDLDKSYFPSDIIVPYIQTVHDRIGIEIMRGCPHKCNFCQACKVFHPLRIRSVDSILEIAERSIRETGYEEISLLSLSSGDYPHLDELIRKFKERFKDKGIKVSLPSLRVRSFEDKELGTLIRKAGLTFAPEAGSDRLRKLLNKEIDTEKIVEKSNLMLRSGWKKVKFYFMIGLPGETDVDLDEIINLASRIKNVNLSISSFIPKPYSSFEKEGMDSLQELYRKRDYLKNKQREANSKGIIKIDFHGIQMSRIEAILCRGDRMLGKAIHRFWEREGRLQAWDEHFNYDLWIEVFRDTGIDTDHYLTQKKDRLGLSWNFIEA
ncbi:MAG: TIGR03960 family B12-binding radical SAM protein [Candidatus Omnitrophota bacterium]